MKVKDLMEVYDNGDSKIFKHNLSDGVILLVTTYEPFELYEKLRNKEVTAIQVVNNTLEIYIT